MTMKGNTMKRLHILLLLICFTLMGNTGCDEQIQDVGNNTGKYMDAGTGIYNDVASTDMSGGGVEDAQNIVDTTKSIVKTVAFVPGVGAYAQPAIIGLTVLSAILELFRQREKKRVKVVTEESNKNKALAEDYRGGLEASIAEGTNQDVADMVVMKEVLNTETKTHFNEIGKQKL